ncbi:MAG: nucleotidyltransferase family protein [Rhodomicrobium sp.]
MNRATVIALLNQHRAELAGLGFLSISIIGSTARGEETDKSDVDLAVTLTPGERGFAHFERMGRLKEQVAAMLGRPVDLIEEPSPSPRIQRTIERDRVRAF